MFVCLILASQYLYDRSKTQQPVSSYFKPEENITEEPEEDYGDIDFQKTRQRLDSLTIETAIAALSPEEDARLKSCLEEIHNIVGDSIPESVIMSNIIRSKFDVAKALDGCLGENVEKPASFG